MSRSSRAELMREVRRAQKEKERAELRSLRRELAEARRLLRGKAGVARRACVAARKGLKARQKEQREKVLADLRLQFAAERLEARATCDQGIAEAKGLRDRKERARQVLAHEEQYRREMRRIEAGNRARRDEARARSLPSERTSESDEAVLVNLPAHLHALFRRVRGVIKAGPRMSRTEAFLKYAEENPDEYLQSVEDSTDRLVRELEERYARAS